MKYGKKIWMNGRLVPFKDAKVHILTHALHYSTAVFEGARCYKTPKGSAIFRLPEHVNRLFQSAKLYSMDIPYTKKQVTDAIVKTVRASGLEECYIRPIAYLGQGSVGLLPENINTDLSISCVEWNKKTHVPEKSMVTKCMISSWLKIDSRSQPMHAKSAANYSNAILARTEAVRNGFDEALLLNYEGHVVEGTTVNLFIVRGGQIITPPTSSGVLEGITRESIIEMIEEDGGYVKEASLSRADVYGADEAFLTGTAAEINAVTQVDNIKIGSGRLGSITKKLQKQYINVTRGRDSRFLPWLHHV
ncbi:MAG: branched chain amino acid aminotransferase [Cenarchaeum symbiont of Oopsacas minuta]|nr:branched chain amino acid aminotransferase [Cenarchaeum symbiont of Oopsacas minuta]